MNIVFNISEKYGVNETKYVSTDTMLCRMKIKIISPKMGEIEGEIFDTNPITTKAILDALPLKAHANKWGDEIYFSIPVSVEAENTSEVVDLGDLGYWPPGNAFCIFFGPTPASKGGEIRPVSPVNVFGKVLGDPRVFKAVESGDLVRVERV